MTLQVPSVRKDDWTRLRIIIDKLKHLSLGVNSHPTFAGLTLTKGPLDLTGKVIVGSQTSPVDVTATRKYGFELHYSGNNYDVTGIRSRAQLVTTDTTATALGGLFQAANNDGINAGVLMGFMAEAIGKSTANASTITTMRGGLIGTEWGALDTITNLKTLHLRGHSLNAAGAGSFGTGYALYIENEAVGGNGQAYDAGIYFKGTNLSAGNSAFTYGIDFTGGTYATGEINLTSTVVIKTDGDRFIHNFQHPTGDSAIPTGFNTFIGVDAGNFTMGSTAVATNEGSYNTAVGALSFYTNTTGRNNNAIGYYSLYANTTGYENSAVGSLSLCANTTGYRNTAMGSQSLCFNSTGIFNTAVGIQSLFFNTTGVSNTAVGALSLRNNTTGNQNNAIGAYSLRYNTTGYENNAMGYYSLFHNTTGYRNNAMGYFSLNANTTGYENSAVGSRSLYTNTTGYRNAAMGSYSLYGLKPTSGAITAFSDYSGTVAGTVKATSVGHGLVGVSVKQISGTVNYNGAELITVIDNDNFYFTDTWVATDTGWWAIVTEGRYDTSVGAYSGYSLTTGSSDVFLGYKSGYNQTTLSNLLIIDNKDQGSAAAEITDSLIYGVFSTDANNPSSQSLRINGEILGSDGAKIGDGGTTNYTQFGTDGLQTMAGTARVIRELWVDAGGIKAPGSKPATEVTHGLLETPAWSFSNEAVQANEQTISFNLKVPPDMDRSVAPTLCLGWSSTTTTGVVEWQLEYLYSQAGETTAAAAEETLYADDSVSGTAEGLVISIVSGINLPHANDVCIHCRVKRLSSATANGGAETDTLADSAEVHGVVFVYTSDKLGIAT